jgi:predicted nucleic acid-binding protein
MRCFFDSSALVKRYVAEEGRDMVNSMIEEANLVAVSRLAYAEVLSALMRRRAAFFADDARFAARIEEFREDWRYFAVFDMTEDVWGEVDRVIETHKLRGADSIHLSTALRVRKTVSPDLVFVVSDRELLAAARKELLKVIDPQHPSES